MLELILALALSALVLMTVAMAIHLHFRMFDVRRTNIEEAQVARAVLKNIADDLRSAVQYVPPDLSGLETVTGNTADAVANLASGAAGDLAGAAGGNGATGGDSGNGNSGDQGGASPTPDPMSGGTSGQPGGQGGAAAGGGVPSFGSFGTGGGTPQIPGVTSSGAVATGEEAGELGTPISVVGLYGSSTQLQFDVSRLPRVDEFDALLSPDAELGATDIPSDIKTVTYFVCSEDTFDAAQAPGLLTGLPQPSVTGRGRGLMRCQLSHAVSAYAESNGNLQSTYAGAKLLAEEVVALQFQYFDGTGWLADWNSDELGGLPVAVEVTITIQPTYAMSDAGLAETAADKIPPEQVYSLIVHLPAAQPGATTAPVDEAAADGAVMEGVTP